MQSATLRSLFLIDLQLLTHAADGAAKPDSDVDSHRLKSLRLTADAYTPYKSHS
jgi:hypothetical protein